MNLKKKNKQKKTSTWIGWTWVGWYGMTHVDTELSRFLVSSICFHRREQKCSCWNTRKKITWYNSEKVKNALQLFNFNKLHIHYFPFLWQCPSVCILYKLLQYRCCKDLISPGLCYIWVYVWFTVRGCKSIKPIRSMMILVNRFCLVD